LPSPSACCTLEAYTGTCMLPTRFHPRRHRRRLRERRRVAVFVRAGAGPTFTPLCSARALVEPTRRGSEELQVFVLLLLAKVPLASVVAWARDVLLSEIRLLSATPLRSRLEYRRLLRRQKRAFHFHSGVVLAGTRISHAEKFTRIRPLCITPSEICCSLCGLRTITRRVIAGAYCVSGPPRMSYAHWLLLYQLPTVTLLVTERLVRCGDRRCGRHSYPLYRRTRRLFQRCLHRRVRTPLSLRAPVPIESRPLFFVRARTWC
jgi:hypothetical protein